MSPQPFPWPLSLMRRRYCEGWTIQEVANLLASDQFQPYWLHTMGREYRPKQKIVNKVAKRHRFPMRTTGAKGKRNGSWNGGKTIDKNGYVLVRRVDHPSANSSGYVREHRLVMEEHIGRLLHRTEVVHHKDGDKQNNHIDNLQLYASNADHLRDELAGRCPNWSPEGKEKIWQAVIRSWHRRRHKLASIREELECDDRTLQQTNPPST